MRVRLEMSMNQLTCIHISTPLQGKDFHDTWPWCYRAFGYANSAWPSAWIPVLPCVHTTLCHKAAWNKFC